MSRINVLWAIDHVCYDGNLHGGGRLFWNVLPLFDSTRYNVIPYMLRASDTIREVFRDSPVPVGILDKGKFDPTTLWTFLRLIKEKNVHVMHLHCYACSSFGRLAGLFSNVPCIIHDYDTEVYFPYPSYLALTDRLLARSTALGLAASPMCKQFMMTKRRLHEDKIKTLLHAIPTEKYASVPHDRIRAVRDRYGISSTSPVICTVTKLGPQRGNDLLLEAMVKVLEHVTDAVCLLIYKPTLFHRRPDKRYVPAGHDETLRELRSHVQALGIDAGVRLIEEPENVDELIAASDLFVAPFLAERFSSVNILEAMAQGKPVVATALGEQKEFIRDGVNGHLVRPGDVDGLAGALIRLLRDRETLERMSARARSDAEAYSTESYARTLERIYSVLAAGREPSLESRGAA